MGIDTGVGSFSIKNTTGKSSNITRINSEVAKRETIELKTNNNKVEIEELDLNTTNQEEGMIENITSFVKEATTTVGTVLKKTGATVGTAVTSLVEGVGQFGEAIVDLGIITETGVATIGTGILDIGQAIYGEITGEEWESITKKMWDKSKGIVSQKYVTGTFDKFYENTKIGSFLKNNSIGFDTVRGVSSGVGYVAGIVALTIATCGAGTAALGGSAAGTTGTSMATVAGLAGMGKGTEKAWNEGATTLEGIGTGALTGAWEGLQFLIGTKISNLELLKSESIKNKIINSMARVVLDGADGGVEGIIQPLLDSIYKDGYEDENGNYKKFADESLIERYKELFEDSGGWKNVGVQAAVGGASSALGEAFNLRNQFNNNETSKINNHVNEPIKDFSVSDLRNKLGRLKEIKSIIDSKDYADFVQYYKECMANDWAVVDDNQYLYLTSEYKNLIKELKQTYEIDGKQYYGYELANMKSSQIVNTNNSKQEFINKISENRPNIKNNMTAQQTNFINKLNNAIAKNGSINIQLKNTQQITNEMLKSINDLSKVNFTIGGVFKDINGNLKNKYNQSKYIKRNTYTGQETLAIVNKLDELVSKIDMSLSTKERAYQIYEVLAKEIPIMRDFKNYADGHKVSASLRGLTANNSTGKAGLVCAGYASAYKELCDRCNIPCDYIKGDAIIDPLTGRGGKHAWNIIIDENNEIIPVDVTWKASGDKEWFGKSKEFAESHIADVDEMFKEYYSSIDEKLTLNNINSSINNIINNVIGTMDNKYGKGEGIKVLKKYINTGNINLITRTNNSRNDIKNISIDDIKRYINEKGDI